MTFTWPVLLWTLTLVPVLVWGALRADRQREAAQARLADPRLFALLVPASPRYRHRLPTILYLVATTLMLVAAARPVARVPLPVNRAAVVLAIDTSQSMIADDSKPTRLDAAKAAADRFARDAPPGLRIGLVAFSDVGTILVYPTTDRREFAEALERLRPQQSTAVGSAVVEALSILPGRREYLGGRLTRLRTQTVPDPQTAVPPPGSATPLTPEDLPAAAIILFSDGVTNAGVDPALPASLAAESRVRVHTVGVGQQGGTVMPYRNRMVLVPFDPTSLRSLAQRTGGVYLASGDDAGLRRIGRELGSTMKWERTRTEISAALSGFAVVFMIAGAGLTLNWSRRVP